MSKVITGKVRLSFLNVFTPYAAEEGATPKYSVMMIIDKKDEKTVNAIKNAFDELKNDPKTLQIFGNKMPPNLDVPLRDGDGERPNGGEYGEECKGHYVMSAYSTSKPEVIDKYGKELTDPTELYSGCYARVSINFYPYNRGKKGIGAGLNNIMKLEDGESLAGKPRATDEFADLLESPVDDLF